MIFSHPFMKFKSWVTGQAVKVTKIVINPVGKIEPIESLSILKDLQ